MKVVVVVIVVVVIVVVVVPSLQGSLQLTHIDGALFKILLLLPVVVLLHFLTIHVLILLVLVRQ